MLRAAATSGGIAAAAAAPRKKHKGAGADSGNSAAPEYTWTAPDGKARPNNSTTSASIATLNGEAVRNHSWPHYRQLPDGTYRKCSRGLPSHLDMWSSEMGRCCEQNDRPGGTSSGKRRATPKAS
jgi:hypothetical protein